MPDLQSILVPNEVMQQIGIDLLNGLKLKAVVKRCSLKKVFRPQASNLIKIETVAQAFSCEFFKISKTPFLTEYLR